MMFNIYDIVHHIKYGIYLLFLKGKDMTQKVIMMSIISQQMRFLYVD